MTTICTAQIPNNPSGPVRSRRYGSGLTMIELLLVVMLIGLMTGMGVLSYGSLWGNREFKKQVHALVRTFQNAQEAAAHSDRRYAVVLDFTQWTYTLRQFATLDLETIPDEEAIIHTGYFTESFQLDYVLFDDLDDTREHENVTEIRFLAGRSGWQYGGKVVVLDEDGNPWSIVIHRLARPVELVEGDVDILVPQSRSEVPF